MSEERTAAEDKARLEGIYLELLQDGNNLVQGHVDWAVVLFPTPDGSPQTLLGTAGASDLNLQNAAICLIEMLRTRGLYGAVLQAVENRWVQRQLGGGR